MNRRNITFAVVAVLALGIGLVVYGILTAPHKAAPVPRSVLIAAVRIPLHAKVEPAMLTVEQRPTDQVDPAALSNPSDAVGQIAMAEIPAASPILPNELVKPATPEPDLLLVPVGKRAITISIDAVKGLAGLLKPGDHVDVIAAPPRGVGPPQAYTIVRDARVLAVGSNVNAAANAAVAPSPGAPPPPPAGPATTATLEVTPFQADLVASADLNATLRLTLRSPKEPRSSEPAQDMVYPTPVPVLTPTPGPEGVPVINGSTLEANAGEAPTAAPYAIVLPIPRPSPT